MTKINENVSPLSWAYKIGFLIILALPILVIPPWFFPPDWGKSVVFRSIMVILLFLCLWEFLYKKNKLGWQIIKESKTVWALAGLFIIYLLASIFSVDPNFSLWGSPARSGGFITFAFYFVFAILTFILLKKEDWKKALDFSIIVGVLVSLIAIIQYYSLFNNIFASSPGRPPSTMGNPIMLATYLLLLSFFTLAFTIKEKNQKIKIFYASSILLFLYTILITGSRAIWLGLAMGGVYFFLFYPKKIKLLKISVGGLLILLTGTIFCANTIDINQYPKFLQQNRLFSSINSRLSIGLLLTDPRFYAWAGIDYKILVEKPVLGYGPENFSVGFDKYYDPSIPYLNKSWGDWWDRAHNIILQTGSDAGFLGIIAYLALFVILFWQLHKVKRHPRESAIISENPQLMAHGIQATLIAYLVANFFSFDGFGSYLIFFLLIGYTLHLTSSGTAEVTLNNTLNNAENKKTPWKPVLMVILFCVLIIFIWQYNILPLQINAQINTAVNLADNKKCDQAIPLMDSTLKQHSFLDSYSRLKYVVIINECVNQNPQLTIGLSSKAILALQENIKIMPAYTRNWYFLGAYTNALIEMDFAKGDPKINNELKNQADYYFTKALELSPKHQEIFLEWSKTYLLLKDYPTAIAKAQNCIMLNPNLGDCYWSLSIAEIFGGDTKKGENDITIAQQKNFLIDSLVPLNQLLAAYHSILDYEGMVKVYKNLISLEPSEAQYYASLAVVYKTLGDYPNARAMAETVLKLSPDSKAGIDTFLNSLPY